MLNEVTMFVNITESRKYLSESDTLLHISKNQFVNEYKK